MTREEAREILTHNWTRVDNPNYSESELDEAFFMAIEALSQPIVAKHFDIQSGYIYCSPQIAENVKVVVRCKDCIHQKFYFNDNESFHCDQSGVVNMHMEDGDGEFFCKYGERREP